MLDTPLVQPLIMIGAVLYSATTIALDVAESTSYRFQGDARLARRGGRSPPGAPLTAARPLTLLPPRCCRMIKGAYHGTITDSCAGRAGGTRAGVSSAEPVRRRSCVPMWHANDHVQTRMLDVDTADYEWRGRRQTRSRAAPGRRWRILRISLSLAAVDSLYTPCFRWRTL